ncbi:asparaginase [Dokdonia pacifica]|uniref:N4-(Beta-N-acetylglucosaminyl)-L-asparaginase n=1 Tax=Dokdonia pacifica TaxID=1627892 RepID=A0A239AEW7_9FLAO|nr:N(4)-(beta-N-acetylglucosaminyl)-L-asparaginase [Dokdonia pacifica]GGG37879.1 asparaginase [Dokdonia pacifica]SNR94100.1 N4-(beta-N-acetylglucosaminyl)-L-asparaginase [Dokdonia pacifica]
MNRRKFIQNTALTSAGIAAGVAGISCKEVENKTQDTEEKIIASSSKPNYISISTWNTESANTASGELLAQGKPALDAIIEGVAVEEANEKNTTVGIGATPDREGNVTLDACVMSPDGDYGAVLAVENIVHVAALARKVMEETPHVIMASKGAEEFAYSQGFKKEKLLTPASEKAWKEWLKTSDYQPAINVENHDTIGMLAMDASGEIAGVCTTSGLGYKMKGRVGDSPIIGSGLFVDNEVGAAVATGMGEEVLKTVGSFLVVELMRNGMSPQKACEEAIHRIVKRGDRYKDFQVAYIAMNKNGETGNYAIHPGFTMMKYQDGKSENIISDYYNKA